MSTLVERLEAEAARTEFIEAREFNAKIQGTRPKHPEPLRALLREAAAALRATGEGERQPDPVIEWEGRACKVSEHLFFLTGDRDRACAIVSHLDRITKRQQRAIDELRAATTTPAEPLRDAGAVDSYPLQARIWRRESTQEWVLELEGAINDTFFISRHTEPLTTAPEDVAGLPSIYAHPAPQQPDEDAVERALNAPMGLNTTVADMLRHPDQNSPDKGPKWKRAIIRAALTAAAQEGRHG